MRKLILISHVLLLGALPVNSMQVAPRGKSHSAEARGSAVRERRVNVHVKKELEIPAGEKFITKPRVSNNDASNVIPTLVPAREDASNTTKICAPSFEQVQAPNPNQFAKTIHTTHGSQNLEFKRIRAFRALDMLAFLMRKFSPQAAGTVAISLVRNHEKDEFMIATKYNLPEEIMRHTFLNVVKQIREYARHTYSKARKKELRSEWLDGVSLLESRECDEELAYNRLLQLRTEIYLMRMSEIANNPYDVIELRIAKLLRTTKDTNIPINRIDNEIETASTKEKSKGLHPEMAIVSRLLERKMALGVRGTLKYQYIGTSMLNCVKCDALLRGTKNLNGINNMIRETKMVFLTKGYYEAIYPGFQLTEWFLKINNTISTRDLHQHLDALAPSAFAMSMSEKRLIQDGNLSESDDELFEIDNDDETSDVNN